MYIVHVSSEMAPIAKVGGLADVVYGLCKELVKKNHDVEIILPKYDCIDFSHVKNLHIESKENTPLTITWSLYYENLKIILLEPRELHHFFNRGSIYGCADDIDRFLFFSEAVLEYFKHTKKKPDIVHLHDWPTAFIAPLYKEKYKTLGVSFKGIALTIHNIEHQGKCSPLNLEKRGLDPKIYLQKNRLQDPSDPHVLNLLKGGIEYCDFLTTVSPTYEKEIKTVQGGKGLDERLRLHANKLKGILNGIDITFWNPATDPKVIHPYNVDLPITQKRLEKVIEKKKENRKSLQESLGMEENNVPLLSSVTRLTSQKGPDLIIHAIERSIAKGAHYILLGSTSSPEMQTKFTALQKLYANSKNVRILLNQNEGLAHQIYSASDIFVIPSIFEPCGLTQMIGMRYGAIPVARQTGGLIDTVFDIDTSSLPEEKRNGFTFDFPDNQGVAWALDRAIDCYMKNPEKWHTLMMHALSTDFSWTSLAPEYLQIYENLMRKAHS